MVTFITLFHFVTFISSFVDVLQNSCPENVRNIHRKTSLGVLEWSLFGDCVRVFFNKLANPQNCNFIKKKHQHRYFPVNIVERLRTPFLTEHIRWLLLFIDEIFLKKWKSQNFFHKRCSVKNVFLEISQRSQENTCARASILNKVWDWGFCYEWILLWSLMEIIGKGGGLRWYHYEMLVKNFTWHISVPLSPFPHRAHISVEKNAPLPWPSSWKNTLYYKLLSFTTIPKHSNV